ncbi:hypothetical protein Aazo_1922 ['Nostoc azollae' 0708]|jgi:hypothetical protein|uniref:Uncharacterized protein n=1 Tax=Nostoc azollae (strain 0708) TaxID=551115 RepID=D7DW96_NOSA0|nr:hypothetical protein Aazo_1922 ['Nostoc azollae' 0708]
MVIYKMDKSEWQNLLPGQTERGGFHPKIHALTGFGNVKQD